MPAKRTQKKSSSSRGQKLQRHSPGVFSNGKVALFLIFVNLIVFVYLQYAPDGSQWFEKLMLYPGNIVQGRLWCLVTSGFLHRNPTHLALNMIGIFIFGRIVEKHLGVGKTLFIYFGALFFSMLFASSIYALIWRKSVAIIGASGALMGLMAAAVLLDPFAITYEMIVPLPVMVKGWLFFYADLKGFLGGERDGVSHLSHLLGFLSMAVLVYFLSHEDRQRMRVGLIINIASFGIFLILRSHFQ